MYDVNGNGSKELFDPSSESNVDMFESQPDLDEDAEDGEPLNPILAAKMRKQNMGGKKIKSIIPPSQPDARNPFAKKAATGLNKR